MSIKQKVCALALLVLSTSVIAQETTEINKSPTSVVASTSANLNNFKSMLSSLKKDELLDRLVAYTKQNGQWLTINLKGKPSKLHISTYLLEIGYEERRLKVRSSSPKAHSFPKSPGIEPSRKVRYFSVIFSLILVLIFFVSDYFFRYFRRYFRR